MFRSFVISLLVTSVCSLNLKTSHNYVTMGMSKDVTLKCQVDIAFNDQTSPIMEQLTRIRILKQTKGKFWEPYAEISLPNITEVRMHNQLRDSNLVTSGHLGIPSKSFLSLTWTTASAGTIGSYKCEFDVVSTKNGASKTLTSKDVDIINVPVSVDDLVEMIIHLRRRSQELFEGLKTCKDQGEKFHEDHIEKYLWPNEDYTLLATADGCHSTAYSQMVEGFINITYQTSLIQNHIVSNPSHIKQPFYTHDQGGSKHVLSFNFCTKKANNGFQLQWPKGSYCVHRSQGVGCPQHFFDSLIYWYLFPGESQHDKYPPVDYYNRADGRSHFGFCCRHDGGPDIPIVLPTTGSFYLYRHKGQCQQVENMEVTNEWMVIDTNDNQNDGYAGYTAYVPDGLLNDLRLDLCYYSKKHSKTIV